MYGDKMKSTVLNLAFLSCLTISQLAAKTAWAGPGGGNGGDTTHVGGEVISNILDQQYLLSKNGLLSAAQRVRFFKPGVMLFAQTDRQGDHGAEIVDVLNRMYGNAKIKNPAQAIKDGDIAIARTSGDCPSDDGKIEGSANRVFDKGGTQIYGAGTICLSTTRLGAQGFDGGYQELLALLVHELSHLYGMDEPGAVQLQNFVLAEAPILGTFGQATRFFSLKLLAQPQTISKINASEWNSQNYLANAYGRDHEVENIWRLQISNIQAYSPFDQYAPDFLGFGKYMTNIMDAGAKVSSDLREVERSNAWDPNVVPSINTDIEAFNKAELVWYSAAKAYIDDPLMVK